MVSVQSNLSARARRVHRWSVGLAIFGVVISSDALSQQTLQDFEAEAFRSCAEDLERLDRILTALEFRRERALRFVAEYRKILSKQLGQAGDRILDNDDVPRLVAVGKRSD